MTDILYIIIQHSNCFSIIKSLVLNSTFKDKDIFGGFGRIRINGRRMVNRGGGGENKGGSVN